ncbi:transmembrane protein, putative [Medicago truncatula]|uniref:Transmembrane protein, putative n=1 Tax=Medicago truncatula TaxID=3880 RepID=A0A072TY80_MEDTR|nr:transmembrane protein, putative [Medicago truncatula]
MEGLSVEELVKEEQAPLPRGAPKVELKPLPSNLRYEFLGPNSTYPVIVNASLDEVETEKLLYVLKKYPKAIGYTIDDIKGINSSLCMHRICNIIFTEKKEKIGLEAVSRKNSFWEKNQEKATRRAKRGESDFCRAVFINSRSNVGISCKRCWVVRCRISHKYVMQIVDVVIIVGVVVYVVVVAIVGDCLCQVMKLSRRGGSSVLSALIRNGMGIFIVFHMLRDYYDSYVEDCLDWIFIK